MAEEVTGWPCDEGELAACFTAHSRDLFGYACVLSDADRALAGDLVQAAFEAAATAWGTLRGLPADQCRHWLHERLAAEAQSRTGHPAGSASVSPAHRRLTELKMARYRSDYDTAAGLDRFAGWLSARADGARSAPGDGAPGLHLARLHAVPDGASHDGRDGASHDRRDGTSHDGTSHDGRDGTGRTRKAAPPGSHGDPVSALYEEHYASLVRLAALLVRDTATAEEIVQDSFVTVGAAWRRHAEPTVHWMCSGSRYSTVPGRRCAMGSLRPAAPPEARRPRRRCWRPSARCPPGNVRYWSCATTPTCPKNRLRTPSASAALRSAGTPPGPTPPCAPSSAPAEARGTGRGRFSLRAVSGGRGGVQTGANAGSWPAARHSRPPRKPGAAPRR